MAQTKKHQINSVVAKIEKSKESAENQTEDHTGIFFIDLLRQVLKTLRLILTMITISYFTGILWLIYSKINSEYWRHGDPEE